MTRVVLEWREPLVRKTDATHPSGIVQLSDDDMEMLDGGTTWACATVSISVAVSLQWCSPSGTFCGSCSMGTAGCCR